MIGKLSWVCPFVDKITGKILRLRGVLVGVCFIMHLDDVGARNDAFRGGAQAGLRPFIFVFDFFQALLLILTFDFTFCGIGVLQVDL